MIAGITYNFLPFMALPLYASLERMDRRLVEAATDLYASRWTAFRKVTLPLAAPGIFAGTLLTFIPAIGDYINAQLLGHAAQLHDRQRHPVAVHRRARLPGRGRAVVHRDDLRADHAGARGAAARHAPALGGGRGMRTRADRLRDLGVRVWATLALIYLFVPIFVIVLFSFNDNVGRFNFTWEGFTLKHWKDPFAPVGLEEAFTNSLSIAALTTLIAVALGTFMALALVRYRWPGRGGVSALVFLPLATPEVVLGAALLGWYLTLNFARGYTAIVIAHVMFTLGYVVVTIRARLEGMDLHIEEAAMDLGANQLHDDPQDHAAADRARASPPRGCCRSRSRSTTSSSRSSPRVRRAPSRSTSSAPRARACRRRSTCSRPR